VIRLATAGTSLMPPIKPPFTTATLAAVAGLGGPSEMIQPDKTLIPARPGSTLN